MTVTGGPKPKAAQVAEALRADIKKMKPGDKPVTARVDRPVRIRASQTIQNGLAALRAEGLIVSAGNLGNFVSDGASPSNEAHDDIKEIRSQIQALTGRSARRTFGTGWCVICNQHARNGS
ncbi:GntR family transcriptional regulator [Streptomyces sp. R08]|uniref:GntR family transcriptional regulator n=1 Tax=Streptomyces sp. R08 TaxID=3238624 RepID=A0AB39MBV5_9ACTN